MIFFLQARMIAPDMERMIDTHTSAIPTFIAMDTMELGVLEMLRNRNTAAMPNVIREITSWIKEQTSVFTFFTNC